MGSSKYEYVNFLNYLFLTVLRLWAGITAVFFFRRYRVVKDEPIPGDQPVIFAVNHQSAFLDPVLIGITSGRKPWYLTRAGVFQGQLVRFILNAIHMLPVYRQRDGVNVKHANQDTFAACVKILDGKGSVLIFPEGNHGMLKYLRIPLRKGMARIAFEAESINNFELGLLIVPVGINYEHPTKFRTDVFIKYGKPYSITSFRDVYLQSPSEAYNQLNRQLEEKMAELMVNITPRERYDEIEQEWMEHRIREDSLEQQFFSDREDIEVLASGKQLKDRPSEKSDVLNWILRILGFPFFIAGALLNLPIFLISRFVLKRKVKDPHFLQSIKFVLGMAGVPVITALESLALYFLFGTFWIPFFSIPLLGIIAYDYWDRLLKKKHYVPTRELANGYLPE